MSGYVQKVDDIQRVLIDFTRKGLVDNTRLSSLDELITSAKSDQFKILNTSRLSLEQQRTLFGAIRNICSTAKVMKEKLMTASQKHENPRTAESSLEMAQSISNLAPYIDAFLVDGRMPDTGTINDFSRTLYKKAKNLGYAEDIAVQFREINITPNEVKSFVDRLNENIGSEMDIDEEAYPEDESSN